MPIRLGGVDDSLLTSLLDQIDAQGPAKRSLWQRVTTPFKAALGASQNVGGQVAGLLAPSLYEEALQRNLESKAAELGVTPDQLSTLERGSVLPGLGDVVTSADVFQDSAPGRVAGHIVGLGGNILGDPLTYAGGVGALSKVSAIGKIAKGAEAASVLPKIGRGVQEASFAGRAIKGAGEAFRAGQTGRGLAQSAKALVDAPFGPLAAAAYAPEMFHGVVDPAQQAFQDIRAGEGGAAVENLAKSALAASMAGLVAHGVYSDAQAARLIREFHEPLRVPPVTPPAQAGGLPGMAPEAAAGPMPAAQPTAQPAAVPSAAPRSDLGGAQRAVAGDGTGTGVGGAGVDPQTGAPLGGVHTQAKLDTPQLGQQTVEPALSPTPAAQNALPALQGAPGQAIQPPLAPQPAQVLPALPEVSQARTVVVRVGGEERMVQLTPEQSAAWDEAEGRYQAALANAESWGKSDPDLGAKLRKGAGFEFAAAKREITGQLTAKEQAAKTEFDAKIRAKDQVRGPEGRTFEVVSGPAFGRYKVRDEAGNVLSLDAAKLTKLKPAPVAERPLKELADVVGGREAEPTQAAQETAPAAELPVEPKPLPPLPDLSETEQRDLAGYWAARGTDFEGSFDTYRGRNAVGKALGLKLGSGAADRISKAVKSAKEALKNGKEPETPLARAIWLDLQGEGGEMRPQPAKAPEPPAQEQPPAQREVARVQERTRGSEVAQSEAGQELQRLLGGMITKPEPAESGSMRISVPRMASDVLPESIPARPEPTVARAEEGKSARTGPTPTQEKIAPERAAAQQVIQAAEGEPVRTGDIAGRVGEMGQRLGHQTQAERAATPGTEPMLPHRYREGEAQERGTVLAPEALKDATPTQLAAIKALHTGEPGRTPMDVFLARARRAISDKGLAEKAEVTVQNRLEKRVLAMSKESAPTPAQIQAAFKQTVRGLFAERPGGEKVDKLAREAAQEVPTIARSVEGAETEAQTRFFQDMRISESALLDSVEGATNVYDFLDKTAQRIKVDGKRPKQWMLDALVELGPKDPGNKVKVEGTPVSAYDIKLRELMQAAGEKTETLDLRRAKKGLQRLSDELQRAIESQRSKSPSAAVRRALRGPETVPYLQEKWEGLRPDPGDNNQFRFSSGQSNLFGRVIRHDVKEPFVLAVMPEGRQGQQSARSVPTLEALAAEAAKHGERELHVNWDWFGPKDRDAEILRTLLEHDPQSPVRLKQLPSKDPEYLRLGIEPQEPPKGPETTPPKTPKTPGLAKLREMAEAARTSNKNLLKEVRATAGSAPDPILLAKLIGNHAVIAADAIAQRGVQFAEWVKELPEQLRDHAQRIWDDAQKLLEARGRAELTRLEPEGVGQTEAPPAPAQRVVKPIPEKPKAETEPTPQRPGEAEFLKQHSEVLPGDVRAQGSTLGSVLYKHLDQTHRQKWSTVAKEAFSKITEDSPEDFQAKLKRAGITDPKAVQELAAVRNKLVSAHLEARENYFTALAEGNPERTKQAQSAFIEQAYKTSQAVNAAAQDADAAGKAVQVKAALNQADPTDPRLIKMRESLKRILVNRDKLSPAEADQVTKLAAEQFQQGNYQGVMDAISKLNKSTAGDKFLEVFKANLMGPASWAAMGVSNKLFEHLRDVERPAAAALDKALTAVGLQKERQYVMPAVGMIMHAKTNGMREGWQQFSKDIFSMAKAEGLEVKPEDFLNAEGDFSRIQQGAIPGKLGNILRTTMNGASVLDRYAKIQAKHTEAMWAAYNAAFKEGLRGTALEKAAYRNYQDIVSKAMDFHHPEHVKEVGKWGKTVSSIYDEMNTDSFQAPADPSSFGGAMTRLLGKHKWSQLIVPFKSTPLNVFLETVRRTPFGFLSAAKRAREKGVPLSKELIKPIVGTTLMGMLYTLAEAGHITGGGPTDQEQNQALRSTGWQPYSIRVGNEFVSFSRLEPLSSLIGIAADAAEGMRRGDFKSVSGALQRGSKLVADNLTNKTFMQGLEAGFTAYSDPERYGPRFLKNIIGSLVPNTIAGVPFGVAARALDPTYRQTDLSTAAQAKVPFLSEDLPAQTDATGEVRQRPGTALERIFSPFNRSTLKDSEAARVAGEMDRIGTTVRAPRRFENIGGQRIEYSPQEYERLRAAQQQATKRMANIIKDPTYQALPDNEDDPRYRLGRKTKADVIRRVYGQFLRPIRQQLEPRLRREARRAIQQQASA